VSRRSVLVKPAMFASAIAALVLVLSSSLWPPPRAQAQPARRVPDTVRAAGQRAGRVRVIVELALTDPFTPEAARPNAAAVLGQRQAIGARAARVLGAIYPA